MSKRIRRRIIAVGILLAGTIVLFARVIAAEEECIATGLDDTDAAIAACTRRLVGQQ
jgi:hypothetical protein